MTLDDKILKLAEALERLEHCDEVDPDFYEATLSEYVLLREQRDPNLRRRSVVE